jgi:hypothetical protein
MPRLASKSLTAYWLASPSSKVNETTVAPCAGPANAAAAALSANASLSTRIHAGTTFLPSMRPAWGRPGSSAIGRPSSGASITACC